MSASRTIVLHEEDERQIVDGAALRQRLIAARLLVPAEVVAALPPPAPFRHPEATLALLGTEDWRRGFLPPTWREDRR